MVGVPKSIDNDILLIDRCFGFETAVAEAKKALLAARVEARSAYRCASVTSVCAGLGFKAFFAVHVLVVDILTFMLCTRVRVQHGRICGGAAKRLSGAPVCAGG